MYDMKCQGTGKKDILPKAVDLLQNTTSSIYSYYLQFGELNEA